MTHPAPRADVMPLMYETILRELKEAWRAASAGTNFSHEAPPTKIVGRSIHLSNQSCLFDASDLMLSLDDFSSRFVQPLVQKVLNCGREAVDHPQHYGGADNPFEVIKVLEAWLTPDEFRGFLKGNAIKYNARARLKGAGPQDHAKAAWYQDYLVKWEKKVEEQKASKA